MSSDRKGTISVIRRYRKLYPQSMSPTMPVRDRYLPPSAVHSPGPSHLPPNFPIRAPGAVGKRRTAPSRYRKGDTVVAKQLDSKPASCDVLLRAVDAKELAHLDARRLRAVAWDSDDHGSLICASSEFVTLFPVP
jgi:hypothetical protein